MVLRIPSRRFLFVVVFSLLVGCGAPPPTPPGVPPPTPPPVAQSPGGQSDLKKVRAADVSILFVGNSHTMNHDLPNLVCKMICFRHPKKSVYAHVVGVMFLDDAARDPGCREEIDSRPWKFVVLQGQRISMSGRYKYSLAEGIDIAKRAKARGATVFFYSEWGLRSVAGDGARQEKVYQEMARAADVGVVAPGRAWDLALAERPDMPLHAADGNHQSETGAFLTAAVFFARLTGESPAALAAFPYPAVNDEDRRFLADVAARATAPAPPASKGS
jgi:hypothetical protein